METKHESHHTKNETHKNTDEAVFELIPDKKEKNSLKDKKFPLGFLTGFLLTAILISAVLYFKISPVLKNISIKNPITIEQAKAKAETFINENLMGSGSKIIIKGAEEKNGLYKIALNTGSGNDIESYMTKDGKIFFPQAMDIEKIENDKKNAPPTPTPQKSDKPSVEVFVMSHCPFGTQIEKGILPVANALGNKINFDLKFVDYAMHGEKELKEELNQYCIKTGEPAKFNNYLKCFAESATGSADESAECIKKTNINKFKLASCVAATDKKFKIMANFADQTTWKNNSPTFNIYAEDNAKYNVQGSPTLVVNGTTVNSSRSSDGLLKTICSAFNVQPKECETALSADEPTPGFGTGVSTNTPNASCGN